MIDEPIEIEEGVFVSRVRIGRRDLTMFWCSFRSLHPHYLLEGSGKTNDKDRKSNVMKVRKKLEDGGYYIAAKECMNRRKYAARVIKIHEMVDVLIISFGDYEISFVRVGRLIVAGPFSDITMAVHVAAKEVEEIEVSEGRRFV